MDRSTNQGQAFHDIRKAIRLQVEEFSRLHRMCDSSRYDTNEGGECFLCLLTTAEVMRAAFEVIGSITDESHPGESRNEESLRLYNDRAFRGAAKESSSHRSACTTDKPLPPTETELVGDSDAEKLQIRSKFLDILNKTLLDAIDSNNPLTAAEACFLTIDAWYRTSVASSDDDVNPSDSRASVAAENQESDDSAAETIALDDNAPPAALSRKHLRQPRGDAMISNSSTPSVGRFESDSSRNEVVRNGTGDDASGTQEPQARQRYSFPLLCILTALLFASLLEFPNQEVSIHRPRIHKPGNSDGYITWRMHNVSDLLARTKFSGPDIRYSELVPVRNYKVRLGVGFAGVSDRNEHGLRIWVSAVVMKNNEQSWPDHEYMQLRLEHENPDSVQTFDFKSSYRQDQEREWRNERNEKINTQNEVTKHVKFMRMTHGITYDDALTKKYILKDSIVVGFKLVPVWEN